MRTNLHEKHLLTVDVYDFTLKQNGDGTTSPDQYFFSKTIKCRLGNNKDTLRLYVYTDEQLKRLSHMRNFKDSNGDLLFENIEYEVRYVEPLVSILGQRDGFRIRTVQTGSA